MNVMTDHWQAEAYAALTDAEREQVDRAADQQITADLHFIRAAFAGAAEPVRQRVVERLTGLLEDLA